MKKGNLKKKSNCSEKLIILMIICVVLSLITLGIVAYDKLIKNDNSNNCSCNDVVTVSDWTN